MTLRPGPAPCQEARGFQVLDCAQRDACLSIADVHGWRGFTCAGCVHAEGAELVDLALVVVRLVRARQIRPHAPAAARLELAALGDDEGSVSTCPRCGSRWTDGVPCRCHWESHPALARPRWSAYKAWLAWRAELRPRGWPPGAPELPPPPPARAPRRSTGPCRLCDRQAIRADLCWGHYYEARGRACQVAGCGQPEIARGLCNRHYRAARQARAAAR